MKPCKTFLIIAFLFFGSRTFAQSSEYGFINYRQSEGLPSNECYYIFRDSKNYLWFATDQGVVRFSGKTMEKFQLPDNIVFKIKEDALGRIWFFSQTGKLSYFYQEQIYPYRYNDSIKKYITGLLITDAFVRKDSSIWMNSIGSYNYEISKSGQIKIFKYGFLSTSNLIFRITDQKDNFFATRILYNPDPQDSVFLQFKNNRVDTTYKFLFKQSSPNHYGWSKDNFNNIYFYNSNFLIRIYPDGRFEKKDFGHNILCINTDDADNIWIGFSDKGATKLTRDLSESGPVLFLNRTVTSITHDYEKGLWFSTLENGIYYIKDLRLKKLTDQMNTDRPVFRIYNQNDSILYFIDRNGVHYMHNDSTATLAEISMLSGGDLFVRGARLFLGASGNTGLLTETHANMIHEAKVNKNGLGKITIFPTSYEMPAVNDSEYFINNFSSLSIFKYEKDLNADLKKGLQNATVRHSWNPANPFISADKKIWITSRTGLYNVQSIADTPIIFPYHKKIFENGTTCIRQLKNGVYVIGLRFGGVAFMEKDSLFGVITEKEGLLNNSVKYILLDGNNIWAATATGISLIEINSIKPLTYRIKNFGQNTGLYNVVIYQLIKYQKAIIAATSSGIYRLDYSDGPKSDSLYLQISNISCYKFDTVNISSLSLPYKKSRLSLKYNAVCFNAPEDVLFYYRMLPSDTTWKSIDGNELILENLQPGTYDVQLKAEIKSQQRTSDIHTFNLTIEKPWWQTNIFRAGAVLFLFLLVFGIYKLRIARIRKADKKAADTRLQLSGLEQKALRSQMNPHFIFNCLTSIQQLIIADRNAEANLYLVRFSKLIRSTLENSATPFVTIAREQEYITEYVILEQLRFPEQFEFSFIVDKNIDAENCMLPGMVLQPVVENSIRHGFKNNNVKGKIDIEIKPDGDLIECRVTDNGGGYDSDVRTAQYQSYALKNIRQRLGILNDLTEDKDIKMEIKTVTDSNGKIAGTTVIIKLPVIKNQISSE